MQVKVLGAGCANCHALEDRANQALQQLGADGSVELITDLARIAGYGVMSTPALVVDGQLVSTGRVPELGELMSMLTESSAAGG